MLQEEIARLTGKLVFQVDNRPLTTFQKNLGGVLTMLRELSTLANKKFTVKVALDSRSLRSQIEKATNTKISLRNVDVSEEALRMQGKRIQDYLDKTTINLKNVKFDVSQLVAQKRFIKTMMGQMTLDLPITLGINKLEAELRRDLKGISDRNPLKINMQLSNNNLAVKLRRAMIEAQKRMGELKLRVADPQVRLKVDKQHLIEEIRAAIASHEFNIRVGARSGDIGGSGSRRERASGGRGQVDRGLSAAMGFARGALPGLGAAFAVSQMNDINQRVTAATNSLEAVSGSEANFKSNNNYLKNMTKEMGLNYRDVAPQFSSIYQAAAPAIGVKGTQDMFRGIMQYGTVHGLDKEAMKGSMVALSQMFGKDKIQSEEARQQFAERMPNGMALLAQAAQNAKLTTNGTVKEFGDLMQKGNADPKKILPELGKLMKELSEHNDAYAKSLETTRVAQGRMNHEFETAVTIFSNAGFDKGMATFFNTTAEALERAKPLLEGLGAAFQILMTPVTAFIHLWGVIGENWQKFADKLGVSKTALTTFASALAIFMLPFGEIAIAIGLVTTALDDLATYMNGGDSIFGKMVEETPGAQEAVDGIAKSFKGIVDNVTLLLEKIGLLGAAFDGLKLNDVFLKTLQSVDSLLQNILSTMNLIKAITDGDTKAADQAATGINLTGGKTLYNRVRDHYGLGQGGTTSDTTLTDPPQDTGPGFWSRLGDWAGAGASVRPTLAQVIMGGGMPTPQVYSGQVDRSGGAAPITTGPISLQLTVTPPEGVSDPKDWANQVAPHIQDIAKQALRDALGSARAQQAERQ